MSRPDRAPDGTRVEYSDEPFRTINRLLGPGWACYLISNRTEGVIRLQLTNAGDDERGWRKCIEGPDLDTAVRRAMTFTRLYTPDQYEATLKKADA